MALRFQLVFTWLTSKPTVSVIQDRRWAWWASGLRSVNSIFRETRGNVDCSGYNFAFEILPGGEEFHLVTRALDFLAKNQKNVWTTKTENSKNGHYTSSLVTSQRKHTYIYNLTREQEIIDIVWFEQKFGRPTRNIRDWLRFFCVRKRHELENGGGRDDEVFHSFSLAARTSDNRREHPSNKSNWVLISGNRVRIFDWFQKIIKVFSVLFSDFQDPNEKKKVRKRNKKKIFISFRFIKKVFFILDTKVDFLLSNFSQLVCISLCKLWKVNYYADKMLINWRKLKIYSHPARSSKVCRDRKGSLKSQAERGEKGKFKRLQPRSPEGICICPLCDGIKSLNFPFVLNKLKFPLEAVAGGEQLIKIFWVLRNFELPWYVTPEAASANLIVRKLHGCIDL